MSARMHLQQQKQLLVPTAAGEMQRRVARTVGRVALRACSQQRAGCGNAAGSSGDG